MKKRIIFLEIILFTLVDKVYAVNKISCGSNTGIPEGLPDFIRTVITLIEYIVPLALILLGSIDFFKVIFSEDKKGLDKATKKFITRSIAGIAVFFVVFMTLFVFRNIDNAEGTIECIQCFAVDKSFCNVYDEPEEDHTAEKEADRKAREELEKKREKYRKEAEEEAKKEKELAAKEKDPDDILNGRRQSGDESSYDQPVQVDGTLVKSEDTDTLRVRIYKNGAYYITSMWVKNPYTQLSKSDSPQYGTNLYRPSVLLNNAVNDKDLKDNLVVGFNASGFYLAGTYDAASVSAYPAYNKTSVGTVVITDGKVVRNAYTHAVKTWYTVGVNRSNRMKIYEDLKTSDTSAKQAWANSMISEIRNTYTFASPLVEDGKASSNTTSMPSPGSALQRQAICQIDEHNFLLITGGGLTRQKMIDIMLKYKCQTGSNFDGGGSIALLYKSRTSTNIETIIGNGRALPEVGYFYGSGTSTVGNKNPGSKTIIIGDSRTVGMCATISGGEWTRCQYNNSGGYDMKGDWVIAQGSMGYSWMVNTAIPAVNRILQANPGTRYNIVSLMGANGLNAPQYVTKYNELADGAWKNHNIVLVSLNPVKAPYTGYTNSAVSNFNTILKNGTSGKQNVSYCDTYSQIVNNFGSGDGLHYDGPTYQKIYSGIKKCIGG